MTENIPRREFTAAMALALLGGATITVTGCGGGSGYGGGGGNPNENQEPLLPNSAELKMLKSMQLRVNRLTEAFETDRGDQPLTESEKKDVANISTMQRDVAEMTLEIVER